MLAPEDENDTEVRREDQENINRFARLNARLHQVREEKQEYQKLMEQLDDASTELMMGMGDTVMLSLGEAFLDVSEDEATAHCEKEAEELREKLEKIVEEEEEIVKEKGALKEILYDRFGKSINLEES